MNPDLTELTDADLEKLRKLSEKEAVVSRALTELSRLLSELGKVRKRQRAAEVENERLQALLK